MAVSYVSAQEFIDVFREVECIQLTQLDDPTADVIDYALLDSALEDATEEANSYLRSRYATPLNPSRSLKRLVMDIARYMLNRYDPPDLVKTNYKSAIASLREVRDGKKSLDLEADTQAQINSVGSPEVFALDADQPSGFDLRGYN